MKTKFGRGASCALLRNGAEAPPASKRNASRRFHISVSQGYHEDNFMKSGILVHGSNHLIVAGPEPTLHQARRLIHVWEFPQIGPTPETPGWSIKTKEFR